MEETRPQLLVGRVYERLCWIEDIFSSATVGAYAKSVLAWRQLFDADHDTLWHEVSSGPQVSSLKAIHTLLLARCSELVNLAFESAGKTQDKAQRVGITDLLVELQRAIEELDSYLSSIRPESVLVDRHFYLADHGYGDELERLRGLYLRCIDEQKDHLFVAYRESANKHIAHVERHKGLMLLTDVPKLRAALDELEVQLLMSDLAG